MVTPGTEYEDMYMNTALLAAAAPCKPNLVQFANIFANDYLYNVCGYLHLTITLSDVLIC